MNTSHANPLFIMTPIDLSTSRSVRLRNFLNDNRHSATSWDHLVHHFLLREVTAMIHVRRQGLLTKEDNERLAMLAVTPLDALLELLTDELLFNPLPLLRLNIGLTMK